MMTPNACWICGKPAVWHLHGVKQPEPGGPVVLIEFWACEKCIPFERPKPEAKP